MWNCNKIRSFPIKSYYHMLRSSLITKQPNAASSSSNLDNNIWKGVSSMKVITRVKLLVWKAIKNAQPVRANLRDIGLLTSLIVLFANNMRKQLSIFFSLVIMQKWCSLEVNYPTILINGRLKSKVGQDLQRLRASEKGSHYLLALLEGKKQLYLAKQNFGPNQNHSIISSLLRGIARY